MPKFSNKSGLLLDTCHDLLQELFREVVKEAACAVTEGHRNRRRQNQLFVQGVVKDKWPNDKHNIMPSEAVNVAPICKKKIQWDNESAFRSFADKVKVKASAMGIKVRWGGDLLDHGVRDLACWELITTEKEV